MAGSAAMLLEGLDRQPTAGDAAMGAGIDTTAAGLRELERGGLRTAVANAVAAAKTRSEQLGITSE
jgi:pyrroline-5-carboxylate reductase